MNRTYLCIDLKSFYASVECVERNLDPFKVDLVVANPTQKGAICLAISPKMKERGIKNRCRIWEIPKCIHPIVAKPRMKKYIEYSAKIYSIYLKYVSSEDIHPYSIDEMFLDVTNYLNLYNMTVVELAKTIINDIYKQTKITATAGIGTNLYLAKVALDIMAKHSKTNIGYLDEVMYIKTLSHHTPLTDFWSIGYGTLNRLSKLHIKDMYDIAHTDEKILYKEFGVNARYLIDHALGKEECTIKDIKEYKPKSNSISNGQILYKDYNYKSARTVLIEMIDNIVLELVEKGLETQHISVYIGYSKELLKPLKMSIKLESETNSYTKILNKVLNEYDYRINKDFYIRRIGVSLNNIHVKKYEQISLFESNNDSDSILENTIIKIKNKFGKNSILRAMSLKEEATQKERNKLIGGHSAE